MNFEALESRQMFSAYVDASHALIVSGTNGNDTIRIWNSFGPQVFIQINGAAPQTFDWTAVTKMKVYGYNGNDNIDASGFRPADYAFPCEFYGGAGSDVITGAEAKNLFDGGAGRDWMTGSALLSTDTVSYESRTARVQVYLDSPFGGSGEAYEDDGLSNIENVRCGSGNDLVYGNAANNEVFGNGGNDTVYGAGGDDHFVGGNGNDELYGQDGDDNLSGGAGADKLVGGAGSDGLDAFDHVAGNDRVFGDNEDGSGAFDANGNRYFDLAYIDRRVRTVTIKGHAATFSQIDRTWGVDLVRPLP